MTNDLPASSPKTFPQAGRWKLPTTQVLTVLLPPLPPFSLKRRKKESVSVMEQHGASIAKGGKRGNGGKNSVEVAVAQRLFVFPSMVPMAGRRAADGGKNSTRAASTTAW